MDEGFVSGRFYMWSAQHGAPAAHKVEPGGRAPFFTLDDFEAQEHDERLFLDHLTNKQSKDAWDIFTTFKDCLKIEGLRQATREEFERSFL